MKEMHLPLHVPSRSNLVLGLKIATIVAATLTIFYQDLAIIANDALQSEFMSHILAIPFLFSYIIYRKRKIIRASISFESLQSHRNNHSRSHLHTFALHIKALKTQDFELLRQALPKTLTKYINLIEKIMIR